MRGALNLPHPHPSLRRNDTVPLRMSTVADIRALVSKSPTGDFDTGKVRHDQRPRIPLVTDASRVRTRLVSASRLLKLVSRRA
jgi:hypothetical protein